MPSISTTTKINGNASNYMTRRRWDYFVRHLLGAEPPQDYVLGRGTPISDRP